MSGLGGWHSGRGWSGTFIEDNCPCPQEPCGLVDFSKAHPSCVQHRMAKTVRQGHPADQCPALVNKESTA